MQIFRSIVFLAALAGLAAGLTLTAVQQFGTQPLIVKAEIFENAKAAKAAEPHDHAAAGEHDHAALTAKEEAAAAEHDHGEGWAPADGAERFGWTLVANVVAGIGFALLLVAASELKGGLRSWREGLLWGLAGFAAFTLAPSIGLPPEAPGVEGAPLMDRQIWWVATAVATAVGIALIAYGRSALPAVAGLALIAAPHIIGAPQPSEPPAIPHDLAHDFVVAVIVTGFVFWATLGTLAGLLRRRFASG
ncbi:CbtA family protein [Hansschlegelia zhihuaiae]|uniref:Cobalt transporter n=1 Tax=Hansschlegelia zhihuaiae TaxID=405005 RepID=A0A4Q0MK49_9HYPH|nr:CbtA family protein [Hansschlegelia zhihuaiae]RXF73855.1 cobalt transporter [Hansschlegelia zhihuaiae]